MTTEHYGHNLKVLAIAPAKDFKSLKKYDNSGWMSDKEDFEDQVDIDKDFLIAVELESGEHAVYTYGDDGVTIARKQTASNPSNNSVGKHVGDMSSDELKQAAEKLGIKHTVNTSSGELKKKIIEANIDNQLKEFSKNKGKGEK